MSPIRRWCEWRIGTQVGDPIEANTLGAFVNRSSPLIFYCSLTQWKVSSRSSRGCISDQKCLVSGTSLDSSEDRSEEIQSARGQSSHSLSWSADHRGNQQFRYEGEHNSRQCHWMVRRTIDQMKLTGQRFVLPFSGQWKILVRVSGHRWDSF